MTSSSLSNEYPNALVSNLSSKFVGVFWLIVKASFSINIPFIKNIFSNKQIIKFKKIFPKPNTGLVNGLYATTSGLGGLTIIEVLKTPSERAYSLHLTGQQGDVMKESMHCALTLSWNILPLEIRTKIYMATSFYKFLRVKSLTGKNLFEANNFHFVLY